MYWQIPRRTFRMQGQENGNTVSTDKCLSSLFTSWFTLDVVSMWYYTQKWGGGMRSEWKIRSILEVTSRDTIEAMFQNVQRRLKKVGEIHLG
jgi:hypothetical protein